MVLLFLDRIFKGFLLSWFVLRETALLHGLKIDWVVKKRNSLQRSLICTAYAELPPWAKIKHELWPLAKLLLLNYSTVSQCINFVEVLSLVTSASLALYKVFLTPYYSNDIAGLYFDRVGRLVFVSRVVMDLGYLIDIGGVWFIWLRKLHPISLF